MILVLLLENGSTDWQRLIVKTTTATTRAAIFRAIGPVEGVIEVSATVGATLPLQRRRIRRREGVVGTDAV